MAELKLHAQIDGGNCIKVTGRDAWALTQLVSAGETGCTTIDKRSRRMAHPTAEPITKCHRPRFLSEEPTLEIVLVED